jgi:hypothetical protein
MTKLIVTLWLKQSIMPNFKRFKETFVGNIVERPLIPSLSKGLFERLNNSMRIMQQKGIPENLQVTHFKLSSATFSAKASAIQDMPSDPMEQDERLQSVHN